MGYFKYEVTQTNSHSPQTLEINKKKGTIKSSFQIFLITDGEFKVAFIPALNISGYGDTGDDAISMLKEIMDDYFEDLIKLSQSELEEELLKFGWKRKNPRFIKKASFKNPAYIDKKGILKNLNLPADTEIEESMVSMKG